MSKNKDNFLDYIPKHNSLYPYSANEHGHIEIKVQNKGLFNRIAQIFFKRPKSSDVELDDFGSFVWTCIDGTSTVYEISIRIKEKFGEKIEPLYPRLTRFIQTLHNNEFVIYTNKIKNKGASL